MLMRVARSGSVSANITMSSRWIGGSASGSSRSAAPTRMPVAPIGICSGSAPFSRRVGSVMAGRAVGAARTVAAYCSPGSGLRSSVGGCGGCCGSQVRTIADTSTGPPPSGSVFLCLQMLVVCTTSSVRSAHIWFSAAVVMSSGEK